MKVVVTGASGHVGNVLVRQLLAQGVQVTAVARHASHARSLQDLTITRVDTDILDQAALTQAFAGADIVYHLAARIDLADKPSPQLFSVNVEGTKTVARAAIASGVKRLVYASSFAIYQQPPFTSPLNEQRKRVTNSKTTPYGYSKVLAEQALQDYRQQGLEVVIVNPCGITGPYDFAPSPLGGVLLLSFQGKLPMAVGGGVNFVDVRDVAKGLIAAAKYGNDGENYLLSGQWHSHAEFARLAAKRANIKSPRFTCPIGLLQAIYPIVKLIRPYLPKAFALNKAAIANLRCHRHIDDSKSRKQLGLQPRPLQQTLADSYQWFTHKQPVDIN